MRSVETQTCDPSHARGNETWVGVRVSVRVRVRVRVRIRASKG